MSDKTKQSIALILIPILGVIGVLIFQEGPLNPANIDWTWPANCELANLDHGEGDHFVCAKHKEKE